MMKLSSIIVPVYIKNKSETSLSNFYSRNFGLNTNSADTVSFKSKHKKNQDVVYDDIRDIPNLPCAICGIPMIANNNYSNFVNRVLYYPAATSLTKVENKLDLYSPLCSEEKRKAFNFLMENSKLYPKKNILEVINTPVIAKKYNSLPKPVREEADLIFYEAKGFGHPFKDLQYDIKKLNPHMHENEEKVYNLICEYSDRYPTENVQGILNKKEIKNYHLKNLILKQEEILKQIDNISKTMSIESQTKVNDLIENARTIFNNEPQNSVKKRNRIIRTFDDVAPLIPEEKVFNKILQMINRLPASQDDVDAFMVKYAQRSSNETIEVILERSRNTFEHIKPHKRDNDNGTRDKKNGICLCAKCNVKRQQTPYSLIIKTQNKMIINTQRQLDVIIDFINNKKLIGYNDYPKEVKESLDRESNSAIQVDYRRLRVLG